MRKNINEIQLKNLAYNIKTLRKQRNMSKKKTAQLLGISVTTLTKLENGHIPPLLRVDVLFNAQDSLGVNVCDLLKSRLSERE